VGGALTQQFLRRQGMDTEPNELEHDQLLWCLRQLSREIDLHPAEAAAALADPETRQLVLEVQARMERLLAQ
jgi:hypothetical protein